MQEEKIYQLALTCIPSIGCVQARILLEHFPSPKAIFSASLKELKCLENIGEARAREIRGFRDFDRAEKELAFTEKEGIDLVFYQDKAYPQRLRNCYDPPVLLFRKGNCDMNKEKVLSIVGTRNCTAYGKNMVRELVAYLKDQEVLVVSGLALGIDAIAHQACVDNGIPTVGVLGQGLRTIYPYHNRSLAETMAAGSGAVLTEYFHDTDPDKFNFPKRNRIVAGMADVTVVVETARKGGSMITAQLATDYHRDVFAVPGKVSDAKSEGCNWLVASKKAELYFSPEEFVQSMGWTRKTAKPVVQRSLFLDLDETEMLLVRVLQEKGTLPIDALVAALQMPLGRLSSLLLQLELKGVVCSLPGKMYALD